MSDEYMPEAEIDNSNKIKMIIGISAVLLVVMVVCLVLGVATKNVQKEEVLIFPESGLSDSIFDSQNTYYEENESLPYRYEVSVVPYAIDVPTEVSAEVDTGVSYMINDTDFIFITEYTKKDDLPTLVASQLGKAYVMELDLNNCAMEEISTDTGYYNGYEMFYHAYKAQFADAEMNGTYAYIMGYEIATEGENMLYIAVSTIYSQSDYLLGVRDTYLAPVLASYHYDEELENSRLQAAQEAQKAQEEQEAQEAEEAAVQEAQEETGAVQSYYDQWYASQHQTVDLVADGSAEQNLVLELEEYRTAKLVFTFTNPTADFAYHLADSAGNRVEVEPTLEVAGENLRAIYFLEEPVKGAYSLVFDAGGCTYTTPAFNLEDYAEFTAGELAQRSIQQAQENLEN